MGEAEWCRRVDGYEWGEVEERSEKRSRKREVRKSYRKRKMERDEGRGE